MSLTDQEADALRVLGFEVPVDNSDPDSGGVVQFNGKGYSGEGWRRQLLTDFPDAVFRRAGPIDPEFADQSTQPSSDPNPTDYATLLDEAEEERKVRNRAPGYEYGRR